MVNADGTGDFKNIQAAINQFRSTDKYQTIYIKNGTYNEKIFIDSTVHHLMLVGESSDKVIITYTQARDRWRCENPNDYGAATINVKGSDLIFRNLTILNDYGYLAKADTLISCLNASGKTLTTPTQRYQLPREEGEKEGTKIVRKDGHQFAFRSMDGATRMKFYNCTFRSGGGDTVSPWDVAGGEFYFTNCVIEGHVDLYCPRGNALIENSLFICHNLSAAIWHDGSEEESDKSVLKNCKFVGDAGFKLGRYHREAQMYLINCLFSNEMADAPIYQAGDRKLNWGHRIYYNNCHRDGGDFEWHENNFVFNKKEFTFKKIFGRKW